MKLAKYIFLLFCLFGFLRSVRANDERSIANIVDAYQKILSGNYELPVADVPIKKPFELTLCDYLPEHSTVDEYGVKEAIKKLNAAHQRRNAITDTETPRSKGDFYHLVNVSKGDLSGKAEVIEDKLYLLKQKTGVDFYVVFQPVATKMNDKAREEFAEQVLEGSDLKRGSNTILITVPFLDVSPEVLKNVDDATKEGLDGLDALEDAIQSIPKLKPTWPEIMALFKRGNDFNAIGRNVYRYNEITLANGKRLDSYIPGKEIISRKATTLSEIQPSTFEGYLRELISKYKKGEPINAPKFGSEFNGKVLEGEYFLEIPASNKTFFESRTQYQKILSDFNKKKQCKY